MGEFTKLIEVRGVEYAPIKFEVANDLAYWSAEIPGKIVPKAEALTGPMTPLEVKSDQEQLQHVGTLWQMKLMQWALIGKGKVR